MDEEKTRLIPFLNRLALFRQMTPTQVESLLDHLDLIELAEGQRLFSQGDPGDSLYIVVSGKIRISRGTEAHEIELATFVPGDVFGEESLVSGRPRSATVTAAGPVELLRLDKPDFANLVHEFPYLKSFLIAMSNSRRRARKQHYDWLAPGETIYLLARRHGGALAITLIQPVLLGWVGLIFLGLATWLTFMATLLMAIGAGILLLALLWGLWLWIDWGNDFYIVSNQRVVWIEKVIGLYDSRNEAPLSTVLSVVTQADTLGRFLEYGNVIVKTYTGEVVMETVGQPQQLAAFISELQDRTKVQVKEAQTAALEQAIRKRLGLPEPEPPKQTQPPQAKPGPAPRPKRPSPFEKWLKNIFMVRFEQKGVITYRKHPILLLEGIWKPSLLILGVLTVMVLRVIEVLTVLPVTVVIGLGAMVLLGLAVWWGYEYMDWRNDLYMVTPDQIIDVYKKPLGPEDRKIASLENILSLQHKRKGLLGLILNYGDVVAMVGGTPFTFDGVLDPAAVQADIFERIRNRKRQQREAEDAREHERVADWMAAYHRQMEALRRGENRPKFDRNSG
jgi:hypothetical protein